MLCAYIELSHRGVVSHIIFVRVLIALKRPSSQSILTAVDYRRIE
jgi:hypothetical protein